MQNTRDIIVIGGSMGAIEALRILLGRLPEGLPAALFAVIHTAASSPGNLAPVLQRATSIPVRSARDGAPLERGTLTVAPPDHHLLIHDERVVLNRGPRENRTRPAIDPLFRSAAVCCSTRVTGILLSGYLDDGAAGLAAVKRCGGLAVVLDPDSTLYPEMPRNALRAVEADHCIPLEAMGTLLADLVRQPAPVPPTIPEELRREVAMTQKVMGSYGQDNAPGKSSSFSCPDCGGPLWQMEDEKMERFRCTVGHAFTQENLLASQGEAAEKALWVALRTLEERVRFLRGLAEKARSRNQAYQRWDEQVLETDGHAQAIRALLMNTGAGEEMKET